MGGSAIRSVRSLLLQALLHDFKAEGGPLSHHVEHWRGEARRFREQAADERLASMRQRIDLKRVYARALRAMPDTIDGQPPGPVPDLGERSLEQLLVLES